MNHKITADHLARRACVYIRQSTPEQVKCNLESKRRQYSLADRARALGWQDVEVIDDDLGRSGEGDSSFLTGSSEEDTFENVIYANLTAAFFT
jgi:hypothetical protein